MEEEEEYLQTDIRKMLLNNLKNLRVEADFVDSGELDVEKPPYYSSLFAGSIFRMVDNMGTIKVKGQNFDYIHIVRRG